MKLIKVALYDTLGPETSEYILNHAEVPILLTSIDKVPSLLDMSDKCPKLKVIIVMESDASTSPTNPLTLLKHWGASKNIIIMSLGEVKDIGRSNPKPFRPPAADDIFCLCYTRYNQS